MNIPVITPAFGAVIGWMYKNICFENYMFTLVLFAVFVKLILFPLGIKQQKTSLKQAKVRPMETAIRKKYAGRNDKATQQKMQQEIMELYKTENVNPAAGCLPLLIQMPILFGLYSVIVNPLKYIAGLSNDVINVLNNSFGMRANYDINI
ncbi:MAG: membrane protein insertase YidC, partial [Clostridia bacterium]|nr:membrane protein insertase YidC [Clostridia bacterium]